MLHSAHITPVMYTDISGKFVSTIIGAFTGALAGALTALVTGGDFWANVGYGALTGALAGLVVDVSVATGGIGGLVIAGVGGFLVGTTGDALGQMWLEGKTWSEVDKVRALTVGGITGLINMASFGIGRALLDGVKLTGNIFQKVAQSFATCSVGGWLAQSTFALAFCSFPAMPSWFSSAENKAPAGAIILDQFAFGR
ncbi:MAG: hypothetical protein WC479_00355 [Candidatus Izemoplasmatales bacterium]